MEGLNLSEVYSCKLSDGQCNIYGSTILTCTNVAAIIINLLHLPVLRNMPRLRELNYFWVLVNISLGDLFMSMTTILSTNCLVQVLNNRVVVALIHVLINTTFQARYWLLALALLDRFYAVCKPFKYTTSKVTNNVGKLSALGWSLNLLLSMIKTFASLEGLCFSDVVGPVIKKPSDISKYLDFAAILAALVPSIISTVLLVLVAKELKRMNQRRNETGEENDTKSATRYIIGTFIMFYVSLIPTVILLVVYITKDDNSEIDVTWLEVLTFLAHVLYGVGNTLLYGALNKAYIVKIKSMCGALRNIVKVSPQ